MRRSATAALLALAACGSDNRGPDAPGPLVTGRLRLRSSVNDANHQPGFVDRAPLPAAISVHLDDSSAVAVAVDADGNFSFQLPRAGQRYRVVIEVADAVPVEYHFDGTSLDLIEAQGTRAGAPQATAGTRLTYDVPDAVRPGGVTQLFTTGSVMEMTQPNAAPLTFDVSQLVTQGGSPRALEAAAFDRAFMLHLTPDNAGLFTIDRVRVDDRDVPAGVETTISGTSQLATANRCVSISLPAADEAARLASALPGATASWGVVIHPELALGLVPVATVAMHPLAAPANVDTQLMLGSPVPGTWAASLTVGMARNISTASGGIAVFDGTTYLTALGPDCTTKAAIRADIPFSTGMFVAGVALIRDNMDMTIDRLQPLRIDWSGGPGDSDRTLLQLFEVQDRLVLRRAFITTNATSLVIDPAVLEPGKTFVWRVARQNGFAGAPTGAFDELTLPYAASVVYSAAFHVH